MTNQNINVALIGNPNTGKTSVLINWQDWISKWGIIPELRLKKDWILHYPIMPKLIFWTYGTYSLNASSIDENVVIELLLNKMISYIQTLHLLLQM
jgi:ferrous iron transport protein B